MKEKRRDKKKFPVGIILLAAIALVAVLFVLGILGIKNIKNNTGVIIPLTKYNGPEITEDEAVKLIDKITGDYSRRIIDYLDHTNTNMEHILNNENSAIVAVICLHFNQNNSRFGRILKYEDHVYNLYSHDDGTSYTWDELLNCVNYELFEEKEFFDIKSSYADILNKWSHISKGYYECLPNWCINSDSVTKIVYPANEGRKQKFDGYICDCEVYFTAEAGNMPDYLNRDFVAYFTYTDNGWKILDINYAE